MQTAYELTKQDGRSEKEYLENVQRAWEVERAAMERFGLRKNQKACDANFQLRKYAAELNGAPDLVDDAGRYWEVVEDRTRFSEKTGCVDLRDRKFERLAALHARLLVLVAHEYWIVLECDQIIPRETIWNSAWKRWVTRIPVASGVKIKA